MINVEWSPGISLASLEKQVILNALTFYCKNMTATAHSLGISTKTLYNKLEKYKQDDERAAIEKENKKKKDDEYLNRCRNGRDTV